MPDVARVRGTRLLRSGSAKRGATGVKRALGNASYLNSTSALCIPRLAHRWWERGNRTEIRAPSPDTFEGKVWKETRTYFAVDALSSFAEAAVSRRPVSPALSVPPHEFTTAINRSCHGIFQFTRSVVFLSLAVPVQECELFVCSSFDCLTQERDDTPASSS